jgi:hypothetical protein
MYGAPTMGGDADKKQRKQEEKQACLPVTIRAIEQAVQTKVESGGELLFFGKEPGMLVLVACVEMVKKSGAVMEVSLNDGSGRIKARHYINENSKKYVESVEAGRYINVIGNVRSAPEVHFAIQMLKPVNSADDVSFHWIEVAHTALKLTKGTSSTEPLTPSRPVTSKTQEKPGGWEISPPKEISTHQKADEPMPQVSTTAPTIPAVSAPLKGPALKEAVMHFLKAEQEGKPAGVGMKAFYTKFDSVGHDVIKSLLNDMLECGDVFNTIDDTHFQAM